MIDISSLLMSKSTLVAIWQMTIGLWWVWLPAIALSFLPLIVERLERLIKKIIINRKVKKVGKIRNDIGLLNQIKSLSHKEFEFYVADLFKKLGYKADVVGGSSDGGIDIVLERDGKKSYVQCKQYNSKVQVDKVRDFYGAIVSKFANAKCYFVTNNCFTLPAEEFAKDKPIELIDGQKLVEYIRLSEKGGEDKIQ